MVEKSDEVVSEMTQPVIIDLGRKKSRLIRELKNGEGRLWDEVLDVTEEVKEILGQEAEGKVLVPIVMLYEKSNSRRVDLERILFPLLDRDDEDDDEDNDDDDDDDEED